MSKYIRASVRYQAMVQIDESHGLFSLAEAVPSIKEKLLKDIKHTAAERTKELTVDSLTFEEVILPNPVQEKQE